MMATIEPRRGYDANDPLYQERQQHAETRRELDETKRLLGRAHGRLYEQHARGGVLKPEAVDAIIDVAIERGQVVEAQREEWRRKFEQSPSEAVVELARTPRNSVEADRAYWEAEDAGYEREMRGRLGFDGRLL